MYDRILVAIDATPDSTRTTRCRRAPRSSRRHDGLRRCTSCTWRAGTSSPATSRQARASASLRRGRRRRRDRQVGPGRGGPAVRRRRRDARRDDEATRARCRRRHPAAGQGTQGGPAGAWSSTPPWCGQCVPLERRRLDCSPPPAVFDLIGPTSSRALTTFGGSMCWLFRFLEVREDLNASGHC